MREINLIVIHCSAMHESQTSCHFYIRKDGAIISTRPMEMIGAHASGYDANSIGICYEGGLDKEGNPADTRTKEQKHSLHVLVAVMKKDYPGSRLCGHRDLNPLKVCPCFEASTI
ncbi:MAG: N-acetylmuramoyl-L-alanine amidase [Bacteroidaceae bacterium]